MSKKILIDTSSDDEIRVAVTENGKLDDFEIETNKNNAVKGDVYLAKITRIEPSLQAAFVDFGSHRHGFLPLTEIHPDYFKIPNSDQESLKKLSSKLQSDEEIEEISNEDEIDVKNGSKEEEIKIKSKHDTKKNYLSFFKKYKIQDVIKPRQVMLVQINKEERGLKGAALTTFLSFAGRYCVLMPNSLNKNGISRKIADYEERKNLKSVLENINIPEKMSVIIRTAGIGKTKKEISKDLEFLTNQWNKIREITLKSSAPIIIYEEGNIIKRTIRDLLTKEVDEVYVEGKNGFDLAKKYTKNIVPLKIKNIKLFKDKDKSLFNENNIEHQINDLFSLKVNLESGGSIVINTTEALVAIDVNSGKNTSERNIENTALKTNLEAANEIARQLRLRDLGGLVVIDFIDMDDYRNNYKVEKTIKTALYRDRARVQIGRISMFGLLELSRQRLRSSLIERSYNKCHFCNGSGIILNVHSISEQIIKVLKEKIINTKNLKILVKCNSALAETLINIKREEINNLEQKYSSIIEFSFDDHFSLHEPLIDVVENNHKSIPDTKEKVKTKDSAKKNKKTVIKTIKKKKKIAKKINKTKDDKIILDKKEVSDKQIDDKNEKSGWWSA
ncbi:MAG: Ribonuclease E [Alphaproteobacteria bacterium MarineAlpha5_Bin6]|nr:MAG: Ribonuclease E [Alphaproteobacteria bacterium MarineAlpha5_Bin7]PPR53946.1 MAG: Ribonuclease E [Alphaproteobacteria bacterium MarineAlpha5_Bin6]|tara:strand:+ start:271 stop:2118 length:1848 start_codon:yes stop_codon:yes gene_type:complete